MSSNPSTEDSVISHRHYRHDRPSLRRRVSAALTWPEPFDVHRFLTKETLRSRDGKLVRFTPPADPARDDTIYGFYFYQKTERSQHFGPDFQQTYLKLRDRGVPFEVIFCSLDESYDNYTLSSQATPQWIKFQHNDERVMDLAESCDISSAPALVLVEAKTGAVLATNAVDAAAADPEGLLFPWSGAATPLHRRHPLVCMSLASVTLAIPRLYFRWFIKYSLFGESFLGEGGASIDFVPLCCSRSNERNANTWQCGRRQR